MAPEAEIVAVAALLTNKNKCKGYYSFRFFCSFNRHVGG